MYNFSVTLENPSPPLKISNRSFELYKTAMELWCKLQYAIWLGDTDQHERAWELLKEAHTEICNSSGLLEGESLFAYFGVDTENNQSAPPTAFDIVSRTVIGNRERQDAISKIFSDIGSFDIEQHNFPNNINGNKLKEFILHYKRMNDIHGRDPKNHRLIKYLLFKRVGEKIGKSELSRSGASDSHPFALNGAGQQNQYTASGIWGNRFKATLSLTIDNYQADVVADAVNGDYIFCKLVIDFTFDDIFLAYLWSNLFDEDFLLQYRDATGDSYTFSPMLMEIETDHELYRRVKEFNYNFHLSEVYDEALFAAGRGSFIPFNIGDTDKPMDDGAKRFMFNSQMLIYVKSRGHDTEAEQMLVLLEEFFKRVTVLWILANSKSNKSQTVAVGASSILKALSYKLDLNSIALKDYFDNICNRESQVNTISGKEYATLTHYCQRS